ncbi:MAG: InlB B-repeat-containing protein [Oscillospiraceae bacterium]|nr:InlB B-repeat-containing protein [Oscillospiraceae bacterium]
MKNIKKLAALVLSVLMVLPALPAVLAAWSDLLTIIPPFAGADMGIGEFSFDDDYEVEFGGIEAWQFPNTPDGDTVSIGGKHYKNAVVFRAGQCNPRCIIPAPAPATAPPRSTPAPTPEPCECGRSPVTHKDVVFYLNRSYTKLQGRISIPDAVHWFKTGKSGRVEFFADGARKSQMEVNVDALLLPFEIDVNGVNLLRIRYYPLFDRDVTADGFGSGNALVLSHLRVDNTHTVTFNGMGGTVSGGARRTVGMGRQTEIPAVTRRKYIFDGWWTARESGGRRLDGRNTSSISRDQTYYARWIVAKPPRPRKLKLTNPSRARMRISLDGGRVAGLKYEIEIATNKKFTKGYRLREKFGTVKLKRNTTYYVRVRSWRRDSAGRYANSRWRNGKIRLSK